MVIQVKVELKVKVELEVKVELLHLHIPPYYGTAMHSSESESGAESESATSQTVKLELRAK